jgi:DNA-binding beta-propeller fold protein YncE/plastocyanin
MAQKAAFVVLVSLLAASGVAAAPNRPSDTAVSVHAKDWQFAVSPGSVPTGTVFFTVVNDGNFVHDFAINGHATPALGAGESATLTVTFTQPGPYEYMSTRDDTDREMNGVLTVTGQPLTTTGTTAQPGLPLARVYSVALPDGSSRLDYQSLDAKRGRLYIAHLGAGTMPVVDVRTRKVVADVHGVAGVHGVLAVPALGRVFASATDKRQLVAIRESDNKIVGRVTAGSYPDGIAYDPIHRHVFVSDEHGNAVLAFDARSLHRIARVSLGGAAGNVQYDASRKRMLVAAAGVEQLVAISLVRPHVVARYSLAGCSGAHGVNVDAARGVAYVACEDNARLFVVDLANGHVLQQEDVGPTPDVLALDPSLHRLYVAGEAGIVSVFSQSGRTLTRLGQSLLAPHAHTIAVDPTTSLVYVPLEDIDGVPVLWILRPTGP